MNENILLRAYAAMGEETPLLHDCGGLCGAACCRTDEDGQGGVYLFPGEQALIEGAEWVQTILPPADDPLTGFAPVMLCAGTCKREQRPLGCRIFPLTPVRGKNGLWTVRLDVRARAMCPLTRSGIRGLSPAFVRATRDALRIIAEEPEGEAFLESWVRLEEAYRAPMW